MKKLFSIILLCGFLAASAQELRFRDNGEFKIVQFTDIHYNGSEASVVALGCIDSIMNAERPDLVVLDGDIIWGRPAKENLLAVLNRLSQFGVPFVYQFGNHDFEQGLSNRELYDIARGVKNNLLPDLSKAPELDYIVRIKSHDGGHLASVLYCMDSHAYPMDKSFGTYAWLTHDQVEWYRHQSSVFTEANGGKPLPALAFFHIPVPEFHDAVRCETATLIGNRRETVCSPEMNSGMFTAMCEQGDVMGIFVGHDHDNDYSVLWHDIVLAYGRYSGGNTVYNHLPCGARVIILKEDARTFDTYIRERRGNIVFPSTYPSSYVPDDYESRPLEQW